jgi:hypothetical protein
MAEIPQTLRSPNRTALIALALIAAASMLDYHLGLFLPRVLEVRAAKGLGNGYAFGDDFYPIWLTTRQWRIEHRDLYSPEMTREIQTGLFGRALYAHNPTDPPEDYRSFAYPAFTDLLFWPATWLEFPALRIVLGILLPVVVVCTVWLWMLALEWSPGPVWFLVIALLTLCNYPALEALFAEQPGLIVGLLLAGSVLALVRQKLLLAGILLALTTIKPQMTLLAIFYLLLWSLTDKRRIQLLVGFLSTSMLMVGTSLLIWPHWIGQWLAVILGYHRYSTPPLLIELMGPTLGAQVGPLLTAGAIGVGLFLAWRNRQASVVTTDFWLTVSLLLAITSVTLLPGQAVYDHVILLPGIFLLVRSWREFRAAGRSSRSLQVVGAMVLFWPWVAAFALIVARPLLAPEIFYSTAVFALPIRTAGSFPFVVAGMLALLMRANRASNQELS